METTGNEGRSKRFILESQFDNDDVIILIVHHLQSAIFKSNNKRLNSTQYVRSYPRKSKTYFSGELNREFKH